MQEEEAANNLPTLKA